MKEKCAIYCRVSTKGQDIDDQLKSLPKFAEKQGWDIYRTYIDDGISGMSIDARPDFKRLLYDMDDKKFDILLVEVHDRTTRTENIAERGLILQTLKDNNIILYSPTEGICDLSTDSGELVAMFNLWKAARERKDIRRRTLRGRKEKVKNGNAKAAGGPNRFGYIWNEEENKYILDEHTAELMLWTAKKYLNGNSLYHLSKVLTDEKNYPIGYDWLLKVFKTRCDGLKIKFENDDPLIFNDVPPVLPPEISKAVKEKMVLRQRSKTKYKYQLNGYIRCMRCYLAITGQTQKKKLKYYKHPNRSDCKAFATIPLDVIEKAVFQKIFENTFDETGFNEAIKDILPDTDHREYLKSSIAENKKQKALIEQELDNLVANLKKIQFTGQMIDKIQKNQLKLTKEIENIQADIDRDESRLCSLPDIETVKRDAEKIRKTWMLYFGSQDRLNSMTFEEKRQLLNWLFNGKDENGLRYGIYVEKTNGDEIHYYINARLFSGLSIVKGDDLDYGMPKLCLDSHYGNERNDGPAKKQRPNFDNPQSYNYIWPTTESNKNYLKYLKLHGLHNEAKTYLEECNNPYNLSGRCLDTICLSHYLRKKPRLTVLRVGIFYI